MLIGRDQHPCSRLAEPHSICAGNVLMCSSVSAGVPAYEKQQVSVRLAKAYKAIHVNFFSSIFTNPQLRKTSSHSTKYIHDFFLIDSKDHTNMGGCSCTSCCSSSCTGGKCGCSSCGVRTFSISVGTLNHDTDSVQH